MANFAKPGMPLRSFWSYRPLQVTADKTRTLPLPPIVGVVAMAGGIVLLVMGSKKN
jgi:hypothetical protein